MKESKQALCSPLVTRFPVTELHIQELRSMSELERAPGKPSKRARQFIDRWSDFGIAVVPNHKTRSMLDELCSNFRLGPVASLVDKDDAKCTFTGNLSSWEIEHPLGFDASFATLLRNREDVRTWLKDAVHLTENKAAHIIDAYALSSTKRLKAALKVLGQAGLKNVTIECLTRNRSNKLERIDDIIKEVGNIVGSASQESDLSPSPAEGARIHVRYAIPKVQNENFGSLKSLTLIARGHPGPLPNPNQSSLQDGARKFHDRFIGFGSHPGIRLAATIGHGLFEPLHHNLFVPTIAVRIPGLLFEEHLNALRSAA